MIDPATPALRDARESTVRQHLAAENAHDIDAVITTFHQPRYEVNGEAFDGEAAVRALLGALSTGFPDLSIELLILRHTDDAVIAEGRMTGTHQGTFVGITATGRRVDYPTVGIFEFDGDRLVGKTVSYDSAILFRQLGVFARPSVRGTA